MTRWAITADLNRCVGCQTCTASCKHTNDTAPGVQWRKVLDVEAGIYPDVQRAFVPVGCMHCDDAPCLDVCPSTATRKRDDGIVTIDYDICIGCAYCIVACPYQARYKVSKPSAAYGGKPMRHEALREDPARLGVAQKCTFCVDRIDYGLENGLTPGIDAEATPACVNSCIADALQFGDADDPDSNVSKLLDENRHFRMHEELNTGPGIYYMWDKAGKDDAPVDGPKLVAEPVGATMIVPELQQSWDWRAAANFIFGGAGAGLFAAATLAGLAGANTQIPLLVALAIVALGLFCVFMEIGRPLRFINVLFHARLSWMTREAMAAMPFFGAGALAIWFNAPALSVIAALSGLVFLFCQAQMLKASKGIPVWRQEQIVPLIFATGLTEGLGLFAIYAAFSTFDAPIMRALALALLALIILRHLAWGAYRKGLGRQGAPTEALKVLDALPLKFTLIHQIIPAAITIISLFSGAMMPALLGLAGAMVLAVGWTFKFTLITKAAYNQGYAINRMPARGAGASAPGVKPGWSKI